MCRKPKRITLKRTTSHYRQMTYIVVNSSATVSISPLFDLIGIIKRKNCQIMYHLLQINLDADKHALSKINSQQQDIRHCPFPLHYGLLCTSPSLKVGISGKLAKSITFWEVTLITAPFKLSSSTNCINPFATKSGSRMEIPGILAIFSRAPIIRRELSISYRIIRVRDL